MPGASRTVSEPIKPTTSREEERLGRRSERLVQFDERTYLPRMRRRFRAATLVDLAHAVMLRERGITPPQEGAWLIEGLLAIDRLGADGFPWQLDSGSFLTQVEAHLAKSVGEGPAGLLQTGRSRLDQAAATERLYHRDLLLQVSAAILPLCDGLLALAERHAATIMPGYTHLQHAQPWTFGHYLMRNVSILSRDLERLDQAYDRTNRSALGGAAGAGTSWPVDRHRVAALLGHDGIVLNALDAGGFARDFIEENTAAFAILMANLGRFATDLYVWSTLEFGLVEIADGLAGTSSIMPQKKNPNALEHVKAIAGQAVGWLASIQGNQRSVLSTDVDYSFGDDLFGGYAERTFGAIRLMDECIVTLTVKPQRMAELVARGWSTVSHLADELARQHGMPHRVAHRIVARFAKELIAGGASPAAVAAAPLRVAAREIAQIELSMDDAELTRILDPRHFIATRVSEGSAAPGEIARHVAAARDELARLRQVVERRQAAVTAAVAGLLDVAARYGRAAS
ncbi:MAG: argininosuccinate lyase [Alphaproteobacteria bacterium]|nr:argininosuccinate lyase [Alphaproteobacteria bacterium]